MAEFVVLLRKEIRDTLTTRHAKYMVPPQKRTGRKKEHVLLSERAHKQVLTVKKNMHCAVQNEVTTGHHHEVKQTLEFGEKQNKPEGT